MDKLPLKVTFYMSGFHQQLQLICRLKLLYPDLLQGSLLKFVDLKS